MQRIRKKGRFNNTWHFGMQDFKERGNIIATFLVHLLPDGTSTGKSLSEALLFAEHGENMLCTKLF